MARTLASPYLGRKTKVKVATNKDHVRHIDNKGVLPPCASRSSILLHLQTCIKDRQDQSGSLILVMKDVLTENVLMKDVLTVLLKDVLKQLHTFLHLQNFESIALLLDMQTLSKGKDHLSIMIQSCKKEFDFALGIIPQEKLNLKISGANEVGRYQKET